MRQILAAAHITVPADSVIAAYKRDITDAYIVNAEGKRVEGDAFDVDVDAQTKMPALRRLLLTFECRAADGEMKYILPVYGAGLWGRYGATWRLMPTALPSTAPTSPTRGDARPRN